MAYTTIDKPTDYFNTVLYTGNGSTQNITGLDFQPDWIWYKNRGATNHNRLIDSVRGSNKNISSDLANAENTESTYVTSFNSDGWSIGSNTDVNASSASMVAWTWKAGTTISSSSTTGSGTAKTYTGSVSTTAGFSIIRYVGNGTAGHTIPHHLGAKPDVILVKHLGDGQQWATQWSPLGATKVMRWATTNAASDSNTRWNDTEPTSSVFTLGNEAEGNTNDGNHIAYCFTNIKGYSKVGSYKGGTLPFIYLGFKPAMFIVKEASATNGYHWIILDNKRNGNKNPIAHRLQPSNSVAEYTDISDVCDFVSNGLKWTYQANNWANTDGRTYIYMAFAESPFVNSNGVPNNAR